MNPNNNVGTVYVYAHSRIWRIRGKKGRGEEIRTETWKKEGEEKEERRRRRSGTEIKKKEGEEREEGRRRRRGHK